MKNAIYFSLEKYLITASAAIYSFFLAKTYGLDVFGLISYNEAIIGVLSILSLQGFESLIHRDLAKNNNYKEIFSCVIMIKLLFSVLSVLVLFMYNRVTGSETFLVWIFYILIPARAFHFFSSYWILEKKAKEFLLLTLSVIAVSLFYKVWVINEKPNIYYASFGIVLDQLLLMILYVTINILKGNVSIQWNKDKAQSILKEGMLLSVSGAMLILYSRVDQIMIENLLGNNELGQYSLSNKIIFLYMVISTAFNLTFVPKLIKEKVDYLDNVKNLGKVTIIFAVLMCFLNIILSPFLIDMFYGDSFNGVKSYIIMSTPIIFLVYLSSSTGKILIMEGLIKQTLYRNIGALGINITLNMFLIPLFGVKGAIIASILAWTYSSIFYLLVNTKTRQIFLVFLGVRNEIRKYKS